MRGWPCHGSCHSSHLARYLGTSALPWHVRALQESAPDAVKRVSDGAENRVGLAGGDLLAQSATFVEFVPKAAINNQTNARSAHPWWGKMTDCHHHDVATLPGIRPCIVAPPKKAPVGNMNASRQIRDAAATRHRVIRNCGNAQTIARTSSPASYVRWYAGSNDIADIPAKARRR